MIDQKIKDNVNEKFKKIIEYKITIQNIVRKQNCDNKNDKIKKKNIVIFLFLKII